jgi:uncharacterized membrane protein
MLVAVGAGFVPFIGFVYSMLFLVVQFGSTTFTPRLNLFRDDPIVWHAFSFFTAVIVFAFTAAFEIGTASKTTLLVPVVVDGADHTPRVVLTLHTWDEYVNVALDEIIGLRISSIQVSGRLDRLLADLLAIAPPQHRASVERRRAMLSVRAGAAGKLGS